MQESIPMIDSHAHILTDDTATYPPSPPSGAIKLGELDNPMTIERLLADMGGAGAVSYTHLDVYKRQALCLRAFHRRRAGQRRWWRHMGAAQQRSGI